jgi:hypothetical protein
MVQGRPLHNKGVTQTMERYFSAGMVVWTWQPAPSSFVLIRGHGGWGGGAVGRVRNPLSLWGGPRGLAASFDLILTDLGGDLVWWRRGMGRSFGHYLQPVDAALGGDQAAGPRPLSLYAMYQERELPLRPQPLRFVGESHPFLGC